MVLRKRNREDFTLIFMVCQFRVIPVTGLFSLLYRGRRDMGDGGIWGTEGYGGRRDMGDGGIWGTEGYGGRRSRNSDLTPFEPAKLLKTVIQTVFSAAENHPGSKEGHLFSINTRKRLFFK